MNPVLRNFRPSLKLLRINSRLSAATSISQTHTPVAARLRPRHTVCAVAGLRQYSDAAIAAPGRDDEPKQYPEKIQTLVDQIASLTLTEVSDLNELLKKTLNIQDAPMMAMGAPGMVAAAPAAEQEDEDDVVKPAEKTSFTIKLTKFDDSSKVKLIKAIKALTTGMNLVQAKKFVESAPQVVKADVSKGEAEDIKKQLEEAGGSCEIE